MARRKKASAHFEPAAPDAVRIIRGFHHPAAAEETFGFGRFYWMPGSEVRESMLPRVQKKRRPVEGSGQEDTAAKVEVLLPREAPEVYSDVDILVRDYQERLPPDECTAYAQVTLRFPDVPNLHHPYEVARAWVRTFFVEGAKGVPTIVVLHAPYLAGSDTPTHVHALVLPRRLGRLGWGVMEAEFASDEGQQRALASWLKFRSERF